MKNKAIKTVALIGCGVIGSYIYHTVQDLGLAEILFVYDRDIDRARKLSGATVLEDLDQVADCEVDLVIEAAEKEVVASIGAKVLSRRDMLIFSVSSLADDLLRKKLRKICHDQGSRLFIPHGAILGIDGVFDGRDIIEKISITTTKNPRNLGLKEHTKGVLYDGPTRGACYKFPRNVNVHATLAIAGLGFDKTRSVVIADPETNQMIHEIHVEGLGLMWDIRIASQSIGNVSGSYTPMSAARTVKRILDSSNDIVLV